MWLLLKGNLSLLDDNLKQHCKRMQGEAKLVKGQKTLALITTQEEPPKKS